MRILLLVEDCCAGVGRHVFDLARGLVDASHEVHLVYSPTRADGAFLERIAALGPGGTIHVHSLPMHDRPSLGDLACGARLRGYVRQHGPFDIIHAHSAKAGLLARTALAGLPGARVYTPHAPLSMNPFLGLLSRGVAAGYESTLAHWTDCIVAVSPEELEHLHGLGIAREKLSLVPNGIEGLETALEADGDRDRPLCIGFQGDLIPRKNLPLLLASFARVAAETPQPAFLAIAGTGPMESVLRAQAARRGIESRMRWLGQCDSGILRTFDIFALPSLYEGLPYVLLESMAAGLPIVSTRVAGVSLLLRDGLNGFAVPVGDGEGFAGALRRLMVDSELRRRMSIASRERARLFRVSQMVTGVLDVYSRNLASRSPAFAGPLENAIKSFQ